MDTQQERQLAAVVQAIYAGDRFLCIGHVGPDGDAVGSLLAMGAMLRHLDKAPTLALHDPVPEGLRFLPGADGIVGPAHGSGRYDSLIVLDSSSADRMGDVFRPRDHGELPLLVIDHHVTNTNFGTVNWVDPSCAATCQMLIYLADALEIGVTGDLAVALLTGIVTDTLCFRTSNTTPAVLQAATRLMEGGADLAAITAQTLNRRPYRSLRLWGEVLPGAQLDQRVLWVTVSPEQLDAAGAAPDDLELSSTLSAIAEADMSATFIQKFDDRRGAPVVECSFRAKPGYRVSDVAFALGGGGHPPAAGCTVPGTLEQVVPTVVAKLQAARAQQAAQSSGAENKA